MEPVWLISGGGLPVRGHWQADSQSKPKKFNLSVKALEIALHEEQAFAERLAACPEARLQLATLEKHPKAQVVVGLAWVCPGKLVTSCLQQWSVDRSLFFLEVVTVAGVDLAQASLPACTLQHWHVQGGQVWHSIFSVTSDAAESWQHLPSHGGESLRVSAAKVLNRQKAVGRVSGVKVAVVVNINALAALVTSKSWATIPFLETARVELARDPVYQDKRRGHQQHVLQAYTEMFPRGRPQRQRFVADFANLNRGWDQLQDVKALKPCLLEEIAFKLQAWAPIIVSEKAGVETECKAYIEQLLAASFSLSKAGVQRDLMAFGLNSGGAAKKRKQYAAWVMLKTVLLASNLNDVKKLRETLLHAGILCFPTLAGHLQEVLRDISVPSAATVSRHRFLVDVAFMRFMRQEHVKQYKASMHLRSADPLLGELINVGSFRYLMTDASPQGGFEWQISQSTSIALASLLEVGKAVVALKGSYDAERQAETEESKKQQKQDCSNAIARAVEGHLFPVAGLGRAAMSLHMKVHALLHQVKLEIETFEELLEFLSSTVSITTDQGTESGIAELPGLDLSQFRPSHECEVELCNSNCEQNDVCVGVAEADVMMPGDLEIVLADDAEGPAWPGPPGPAADAVVPLRSAECPAEPAPAGLVPLRAGSSLPDGHYLWPFTLVVVGMLHICHNALEEMSVNLPCWEEFVEQLRPLASFLHSRACRQRLEDKCLRQETEANKIFRQQLQKSFHSLYTARWGSMTTVLEEVLSVRALFQTAWDAKVYAQGSSESQALTAQLAALSQTVC